MPEDNFEDTTALLAAFDSATPTADTIDDFSQTEDKPIEDAPADNTVVDSPPADTTPAATATNYDEYFTKITEGFIKDENTFKAYLPKIRGYDELETKVKDLETKVPTFKNEESKNLFDLWQSGDEGRAAVKSYIRETEKDYRTMSDIDIRREALSKAHANWSSKDVELELRHTYGANLEKIDLVGIDREAEPEEYTEAVAHNKEVDKNLELLAVHARDDRYKLIDDQDKIELPKINKQDAQPAAQGPTEQEIAEANAKWVKNVEDNVPKLSNIKQTIDDKEVEYVSTEDEKKELMDEMKSFNIFNYAKKRGWYNEDGSPNSLKIAEDVQKLNSFDKITKSFATQVKTDTTRDVMAKIKNIDDKGRTPHTQTVNSLSDAYYAALDAKSA